METLLALSWRVYPATLLAVAAALLLLRGARTFAAGRAKSRDPERALGVARGARIVILGLCLLAFALGWLAEIGWLMVLALIVLGEEMLETSVLVAALEDGRRRAREGAAGDRAACTLAAGEVMVEDRVSCPTLPSMWSCSAAARAATSPRSVRHSSASRPPSSSASISAASA